MSNPPTDRRASPLEPTSPALGGLRSPSPEVMSSAIGGLEEAASLSATADLPEARLARGILRRRLRAADGRKPALSRVEGKPLDVLREARDECVEPQLVLRSEVASLLRRVASEGRDT